MSKRNRKIDLGLLFAAALVLLSLWRDAAFLFASPYPYGIDGYYYAALAEPADNAALERSGGPIPVMVLRALGRVMEPAAASKIFGLLCLYGAGAVAFLFTKGLTRSLPLSFLSFFLIVKGFMRGELLVNFPKQSLALVWLLLTAMCLFTAPARLGKSPFLILAFLLLCQMMTHNLGVALALGLIASLFLMSLFTLIGLRRPGTIFMIIAWFLPWIGTFIAALWPKLAGQSQHLVYFSTSTSPRFNVPIHYDGVSPIAAYAPLNLIQTVALCSAIVVCIAIAWKAESRDRPYPLVWRRWSAAAAFVPQVALTFSPFFVGGDVYSLGLHFRLIGALGVTAAVIIPAAIAIWPPAAAGRRRRGLIATLMIAAFALPPAAWPASTLPPEDGGALHHAMVAAAPLIPEDSVIITTVRTGNMVNALWRRPRVIATRFDVDTTRANYYRFLVLHPSVASELQAFSAQQTEYPVPLKVHGPWILVKEELYRAFREHLRRTAPDLLQKLLD